MQGWVAGSMVGDMLGNVLHPRRGFGTYPLTVVANGEVMLLEKAVLIGGVYSLETAHCMVLLWAAFGRLGRSVRPKRKETGGTSCSDGHITKMAPGICPYRTAPSSTTTTTSPGRGDTLPCPYS